MTPVISFMSANYVAREVGYRMTGGWGQGDRATNERFRPPETFAERFDELLRSIRALGFDAVDVWSGHLNPSWATREHLDAARELLTRHGLRAVSLGGGFDDLDAACDVADAVGTDLLAGPTGLLRTDRARALAILRDRGKRIALENHPEKTPEEMLVKIGNDADGLVGTTVDTGWWGTQSYDAALAIERLAPHVLHVHLKDVLAAGEHETCRWGLGVVDVESCVRRLRQLGYAGAFCVEHEPELYDPSEDCRELRERLVCWLA